MKSLDDNPMPLSMNHWLAVKLNYLLQWIWLSLLVLVFISIEMDKRIELKEALAKQLALMPLECNIQRDALEAFILLGDREDWVVSQSVGLLFTVLLMILSS